MKVRSFLVTQPESWQPDETTQLDSENTLVLAFGSMELADDPALFQKLAAAFPKSIVLGCSTAGQIHGTSISDRTLSVAVAKFDRTRLALTSTDAQSAAASSAAGEAIAKTLNAPDLRAIFLLSDGLNVNGSELIRGINQNVGPEVVVTGGLAGDGDRFKKTWVLLGAQARDKRVVAVGLYGEGLVVGHGSKGGWDAFGPQRTVTKSSGNVLYELGGRPALDVYRDYLGELARGLPATALLFPLALKRQAAQSEVLVRTILSVDDETKSMTFAGDIPEGSSVQLMRANFERLIDGASEAARLTKERAGEGEDSLSIAISCVGRRLVLGERAEEEVESAMESLPDGTSLVGFYSYGEISPYASGRCDLHNQTMTLTNFREAA